MSTPENESFLSVAKRIREARGRTPQKAFAKAVGMSATSLSQLENAQTVPKLDTLLRIARKTERPLDWFVSDEHINWIGEPVPLCPPSTPTTVNEALQRIKAARKQLELAEEQLESLLGDSVGGVELAPPEIK